MLQVYPLESVLFLYTVHISDYRVESVVFCSHYIFLMYHLECILFVCTLNISDVPSAQCSVSVHSTHFWYTVWKVFCFCAQYTFLMSSDVLFFYVIYSLVQMEKFLFCLYCFLVISPCRRQFQSLSKHVTAVRFLMNLPDTKYSSYTRITVRYDVS